MILKMNMGFRLKKNYLKNLMIFLNDMTNTGKLQNGSISILSYLIEKLEKPKFIFN